MTISGLFSPHSLYTKLGVSEHVTVCVLQPSISPHDTNVSAATLKIYVYNAALVMLWNYIKLTFTSTLLRFLNTLLIDNTTLSYKLDRKAISHF